MCLILKAWEMRNDGCVLTIAGGGHEQSWRECFAVVEKRRKKAVMVVRRPRLDACLVTPCAVALWDGSATGAMGPTAHHHWTRPRPHSAECTFLESAWPAHISPIPQASLSLLLCWQVGGAGPRAARERAIQVFTCEPRSSLFQMDSMPVPYPVLPVPEAPPKVV